MAGVGPDTGCGDALDVLTVLMLEIPTQQLRKWRAGIDRAVTAAQVQAGRFDRRTWGLAPHQVEQQRLAMRTLGRGGGG